MAFCDFCTCDDCLNGTKYLSHAQTENGLWICDVCYTYDLCTETRGIGPCENKDCTHRPKLISDWIKYEI